MISFNIFSKRIKLFVREECRSLDTSLPIQTIKSIPYFHFPIFHFFLWISKNFPLIFNLNLNLSTFFCYNFEFVHLFEKVFEEKLANNLFCPN